MSTIATPAEVATAALGKEPTTDAEREEWARLRDAIVAERAASAPVLGAVHVLASIALGMYDAEALGGLQCAEVEAIADVLRAAGHDESADVIVEAHAHGDDDEHDEHHGRYVEIRAEHAAIDARIDAERAEASAPVRRCSECRARIDADDMGAGHGMCGGCLHDAIRSGWEPGANA